VTQTSIDVAGRGDNSYAVPSPTEFEIGLVQMRCSTDPADNLARALDQIRAAAKQGAQLVCLPELFRSQYFCQTEDHANFDLAEPIPGPSTEALSKVAREAGVVVIGSLFERRAAGVYHNTAVILDADGKLLGSYRKMHIPDDPLYYEKFYFTPGDLGFRAFDTAVGRIGTLVCWDQWYPEGARLTALAGADVLFYPTAIGWHPDEKAEFGAAQASAWQTAQRAHAIANGVYVAAVNRVGWEKPPAGTPGKGIEFWGGSFVADPFGVVLAEASRVEEETLIVTCDRKHQETVRRHWPFLRDRRIDAYGGVTRRLIDE
jgi:N-carbamoylputrescine amidase